MKGCFRSSRVALLTLIAAVGVSGCATQAQRVGQKEDLLSAAGFVIRPADTPARQQQLASLPPEHFMRRVQNGDVKFLYADKIVCDCLYIGDQAAWSRYQQMRFQKNLADQQALNAQMWEDSGWDWGPWGP